MLDELTKNLDTVLTAVPHFVDHPDLAHAAATSGGDVAANAQHIAGAQIVNALAYHGHRLGTSLLSDPSNTEQLQALHDDHYANNRLTEVGARNVVPGQAGQAELENRKFIGRSGLKVPTASRAGNFASNVTAVKRAQTHATPSILDTILHGIIREAPGLARGLAEELQPDYKAGYTQPGGTLMHQLVDSGGQILSSIGHIFSDSIRNHWITPEERRQYLSIDSRYDQAQKVLHQLAQYKDADPSMIPPSVLGTFHSGNEIKQAVRDYYRIHAPNANQFDALLDDRAASLYQQKIKSQNLVGQVWMNQYGVTPDETLRTALGITKGLWDSLQHLYRETKGAYQQHGSEGVVKVLMPVLAGAAIGTVLDPLGGEAFGMGGAAAREAARDALRVTAENEARQAMVREATDNLRFLHEDHNVTVIAQDVVNRAFDNVVTRLDPRGEIRRGLEPGALSQEELKTAINEEMDRVLAAYRQAAQEQGARSTVEDYARTRHHVENLTQRMGDVMYNRLRTYFEQADPVSNIARYSQETFHTLSDEYLNFLRETGRISADGTINGRRVMTFDEFRDNVIMNFLIRGKMVGRLRGDEGVLRPFVPGDTLASQEEIRAMHEYFDQIMPNSGASLYEKAIRVGQAAAYKYRMRAALAEHYEPRIRRINEDIKATRNKAKKAELRKRRGAIYRAWNKELEDRGLFFERVPAYGGRAQIIEHVRPYQRVAFYDKRKFSYLIHGSPIEQNARALIDRVGIEKGAGHEAVDGGSLRDIDKYITDGYREYLDGIRGLPGMENATPFHDFLIENSERLASPINNAMRYGRAVMHGAATGTKVLLAPVKYGIKALDRGMSHGGSLAAQVTANAVHPYEDIWNQTKNSDVTLGKDVFGKGTFLASLTDGIISLFEAPIPALKLGSAGRIAASKGAMTVEKLDQAWAGNKVYRRALESIAKLSAAQIADQFPNFAPVAVRLARHDTAEAVHEEFRAIVNANDFVNFRKLPTQGMYGALKQLKTGNNAAIGYFARLFTQSPLKRDEMGFLESHHGIVLGDPSAVPAVTSLLRQIGMRSADIYYITQQLLEHPEETTHWANTIANGIEDFYIRALDKEFIAARGVSVAESPLARTKEIADLRRLADSTAGAAGFDIRAEAARIEREMFGVTNSKGMVLLDEEAIRLYQEMHGLIRSRVESLINTSHSGGQLFAHDWDGRNLSPLTGVNQTPAAVWMTQRAELRLPSFQNANRAYRTLFKQYFGRTDELFKDAERARARADYVTARSAADAFKNRSARAMFWTSGMFNKYVNDAFFKPLALATPGWAMRVSASELMLNTARLGPRDIVAGHYSRRMYKQLTKMYGSATRVVMDATSESRVFDVITGAHGLPIDVNQARHISMAVRGIMAGIDEGILHTINRDEFIDAAIYLSHRHAQNFLPDAVNSVHHPPGDMVEVPKSEFGRFTRKGKVRMKRMEFSGEYVSRFYGSPTERERYVEAWMYTASQIAADDVYGRRVASAYLAHYEAGLRGEALSRATARSAMDIIDQMPENLRMSMARAYRDSAAASGDTPTQTWARTSVAALEGVIYGSDPVDRYFHERLLRDMVSGDMPFNYQEFERAYMYRPSAGQTRFPEELNSIDLPRAVIGRDVVDTTSQGSVFQRLSQVGHEKLLGPMVNKIVREPVFIADWVRARKNLNAAVDLGHLTSDQADMLAEVHAAQEMIRFIHNPEDKTKFEELMRTVAPFYFAQNQAWRRAGRLFSQDPAAFVQYAMAMYGIVNWVGQTTTKNGMPIFYFPSSMWSIPFTGSLSSLSTMNPFSEMADPISGEASPEQLIKGMLLPKFGPVVSIPAHLILVNGMDHLMGEHGWAERNWLGKTLKDTTLGPVGSNALLWQSFVPNSVIRNLMVGSAGFASMFAPIGSKSGNPLQLSGAYAQVVMEALKSRVMDLSEVQYAKFKKQGLTGPDLDEAMSRWMGEQWDPKHNPNAYAQLLEQANVRAGALWVTKMALGLFTPVSAGVGKHSPIEKKILDEIIKKEGYPKGLETFYKKYPYATIETLSSSKSNIGPTLFENKKAYEAVVNDPYGVHKYPNAFLAFHDVSGGDKAFYAPANSAYIALGLRSRETPEDFIKNLMVQSGNNWYYNVLMPQYNAYREKYPDHKGDIYRWRQSMVQWYAEKNPTWNIERNPQIVESKKAQEMQELQQMLKDPKYSGTKEAAAIRTFMNDKQYGFPALEATAALVKAGKTSWENRKKWWEENCNWWVRHYPAIGPAMDAIFRRYA